MEWQTEAIDTDAHPLPAAAATLVKEPPKTEPVDGLDALSAALAEASASLSPSKSAMLRSILKHVRESIENALKLLDDAVPETPAAVEGLVQVPSEHVAVSPPHSIHSTPDDRLVEGVFDGQGMVGGDGKSYAVPPNYASKSKLVEGDMLKLTIGARGNFIYKQIGPIERQRLIGTLAYDQETGQYLIVAGGRSWKVLKASITYYKAEAGDEAVILVPKNAPSKWAAVENIIRKSAVGSQNP